MERSPEAVELIVSVRDDKNAVIAERRYAHGLGEALESLKEMRTETSWAADCSIEEGEIA
jgi:hypothetical protein